MAEDKSRYYKMRLFDPTGAEVSTRVFRIYPEDENGREYARMQGAFIGHGLGDDAITHAKSHEQGC